jgi:hypothetical protein
MSSQPSVGRVVTQLPGAAVRRARHRVRARVSEHPRLYLPFARRKYPGPSPEVIGPQTELVIDGYTRCGTTFAVYAFQLAQDEPVRLAHHLHAPAQVIQAVRRAVPTLVVIREPEGAILSQLVREPQVALPDALAAYVRYYTCLMRYRDGFVIGELAEVTQDFGAVVRRLNARFGTSYAEFEHTPASVQECLGLIRLRGTHSRTLLGFESGVAGLDEVRREQADRARDSTPLQTGEEWVPSAGRERSKAALREQWLRADVASRIRARRVYEEFLSW